MKKFLVMIWLLSCVGCEIHNYRDGTMYTFPEPEVAIVVESPPEVVVVEPEPEVIVVHSEPEVIVVKSEPYWYEDYCIDTAYDSCCYSYEYYDNYTNWQVCEIMECYNPYSGYYQYEGQTCWYE